MRQYIPLFGRLESAYSISQLQCVTHTSTLLLVTTRLCVSCSHRYVALSSGSLVVVLLSDTTSHYIGTSGPTGSEIISAVYL
jgi:hypothetical protein